jgi:hypothetical protein
MVSDIFVFSCITYIPAIIIWGVVEYFESKKRPEYMSDLLNNMNPCYFVPILNVLVLISYLLLRIIWFVLYKICNLVFKVIKKIYKFLRIDILIDKFMHIRF